jgi:hypothetical protein
LATRVHFFEPRFKSQLLVTSGKRTAMIVVNR